MQEALQKLRDLVPIETLAAKYTNLKKTGANYKGLCPFHKETVPSFVVSPNRGMCFCFGCQTGGDVIKLVQHAEKVSFGEAVHRLAERYEIDICECEFEDDEKELAIMEKEGRDSFLRLVRNRNSALNYLNKRGVFGEVIANFGLGCSKDYSRIIFPIANQFGRTVGFTRRLISGEGAKYMNSRNSKTYDKSKLLYGLSQAKKHIKKEGFVVLVEGQFDVIMSHHAGVKNCVGLSGTVMSDAQVAMLRHYTKRFVIALDDDPTGKNAATKICKCLEQYGVSCEVVCLKNGADPDQFIRDKGASAWKDLIYKNNA